MLSKHEKIFLCVAGVIIIGIALVFPFLRNPGAGLRLDARHKVYIGDGNEYRNSVELPETIEENVPGPLDGKYIDRAELVKAVKDKRLTDECNPFYFKYDEMFGIIDPYSRNTNDLERPIPHIRGLSCHSLLWYCQRDTCRSYRTAMALRCPQNSVMLDWMKGKCAEFVEKNLYLTRPEFSKTAIINDNELCTAAIDYISTCYAHETCVDIPERHGVMNEQNGLLITDVYQTDDYCTFFYSDWYDMMSCGCNFRRGWHSVSKKTGEELRLSDMVDEEDYTKLLTMVIKHLRNRDDYYITLYTSEPDDRPWALKFFYESMSGCALLQEGMVIYYDPYTIGIGAEGDFYAVIPYNELKNLPHGFKMLPVNPRRSDF